MNKDTLSIIVGFIDYQDLFSTVKVDRLWQKVSQNQLNIRHQSNPILPILHNKSTQIDFVGNLHQLYRDYLTLFKISFHSLLIKINSSSKYGYNNDDFINIFANHEVNKRQSYWQIILDIIDLLFEHVITHLCIKINDNSILMHSIDIYVHKTSLFEKGFVILMYFKSLLTTVHYRFPDFIIYDKTKNYSIGWNVKIFQNKLPDK